MDTKQIQYFLAVYRYKGFTSAARHLHISQSTLSRQISALEEELGAALLVRNQLGVTLTDAGKLFLQEGKDILQRYERMQEKISKIGAGRSGRLLVGMPMNLFGQNAILDRYDPATVSGEVEFRHCVLDFDELNQGLLNGDIDLAITYDFAIEKVRDELKYQYVFREPFVFFVRQSHPLSHAVGISLADLVQSGLTVLKTDIVPPFLRQILHHARQEKADRVYYSQNPESMLIEVSTSNRVGVIPKSLFASSQEAYGLVAIHLAGIDTNADFVIAHHKGNINPLISTYTSILRNYIWNRKW